MTTTSVEKPENERRRLSLILGICTRETMLEESLSILRLGRPKWRECSDRPSLLEVYKSAHVACPGAKA